MFAPLLRLTLTPWVFLSLCIYPTSANSAKEEKAAPPKPTVFIEKLKEETLVDRISYPGQVFSKVQAKLYAEIDGSVFQVLGALGKKVERGDKLVVLKHTDPIYQYAPVVMRSPVSGRISRVEVNPGTQVTRGAPLLEVTDPSAIRIKIEMVSTDARILGAGMRGTFSNSDLRENVSVQIEGVSPIADATTGTQSAELTIQQNTPSLAVGMIGRVEFRIRERRGFMIPESAVIYQGGETFARVLENNRAKRVKITLGPPAGSKIEVLGGLSNGTDLIVRTSAYVADGEEVTVYQ